MARDDELRGIPRAIDALGVGMLLAGTGITLATVGGLWYGPAMIVLGLASRAAAYAVGAWEIGQRGVTVPKLRPGRDGRSPTNELEAVQLLEQELAEQQTGFVTMLEEQRRGGVGKGI